jgi:phage-related protein
VQKDTSSLAVLQDLPSNYYKKVDKKLSSVNDQLTKKSVKYLAKFQRQEQKLQQRLLKLHPELAVTDATEKYTELSQKIKSKTGGLNKIMSGEYNPNMDSLGTSLNFLKQFNGISDKVNNPLKSFDLLQGNLQESEKIKAFIAERKNQIKELLSKYTHLPAGLKNEYAKLNKTAYYYSSQVKEYKEMLKDPDKMERKALSILSQLPIFQKFMKENSQLANLFGIPANYGNAQALQGLQTIDQVQQLVRSRIGSGPNATAMLQSQVQAAQGELNKFKDKLNKLGGGSGDIEMPDFKPNNQKTKPFLQRLEYGSNIQTTRGTYNFPTTTDLGLSVGYKLNNKSTIGIGASYKQGWGKDIKHIRLTSEGIGMRSYFEYKLKKSFYATGGFEYNYQQPFSSVQHLLKTDWAQSGLIGISKVVDIKSKMFKKTKVQLLWDFLSYEQVVRTQPLKFRVGYDF